MKITKRQLKRIIREENLKLNEMFPGDIRSGVGRSVNQTMGRDESPKPGEIERSLADKVIVGKEDPKKGVLEYLANLDDVFDDIIEEAAPIIVQKILEREVDEDVEEFHDGASSAYMIYSQVVDYRAEEREIEEEYERMETPQQKMGFRWMQKNDYDVHMLGGVGSAFDLSPQLRIELANQFKSEIEEEITEEFIIDLLERTYGVFKEKAQTIHAVMKKIASYGWLGFVGVGFIEVFEHFILPKLLYGILGPAALALAAIPLIEISAIVGLVIYDLLKKKEPYIEPPPGHFDLAQSVTAKGNLEIQKLISECRYKDNVLLLSETSLRKLIKTSIIKEIRVK